MWLGIMDVSLIVPYFLPDTLNSEIYENFLRNNSVELLKDVLLANRVNMIFPHDGCSAHYDKSIRNLLVKWMKETVYVSKINTCELSNRITDVAVT